MTRKRDLILAGVCMAVLAAASACGGAAKPDRGPPPAGYKWADSFVHSLRFAVPGNWVVIDLAKTSAATALTRLHGVKGGYMDSSLEQLASSKAIVAADTASARRSPHQFNTNANGFCAPAPANVNSASGLAAGVRAEFASSLMTLLAVTTTTIAGEPGVKVEATKLYPHNLTVRITQYLVLVKHDTCAVTLSTDNRAAFRQTFNKIGSTIRVP